MHAIQFPQASMENPFGVEILELLLKLIWTTKTNEIDTCVFELRFRKNIAIYLKQFCDR